MKRPIWMTMAMMSVMMVGCGELPMESAFPLAALEQAETDGVRHEPAGTTRLYGAFLNVKVLAKRGQRDGHNVFLVAATPDSDYSGRFQVTFWNHDGVPEPQVGDTVSGMVNYPLVDRQERAIVPDKFPYSFWAREF